MAEPATTGPEPTVELIDASGDAPRAMASGLVAHRVGQDLDGLFAGDPVAVQVEQGVELGERQPPVASQDGEAGSAQGAAPEEAMVGGQRAQRRTAIGLRTTPVVVGEAGPQLLPHVLEWGEHGHAAVVEAMQLAVEDQQLREEPVALDLEAVALEWAQV
jgi:hypothetical protein